jgi:Kdo2-lipid IVA lauroyltransferase/acyltransferase
MLTYLGYRFVETLAVILPYPIAYLVAQAGFILVFTLGVSVNYIKKNISIVLNKDISDPMVSDIALKVYINWARNVVDFLKHRLISSEKLKRRISLDGLNHLDDALKKKKGVVIFTCHVGNFEWGACRLAVEGYSIWGVSLVRKSRLTNDFFEQRRLSKGLKTLYINRMIHVFRYLRDNEIVAIPSDWNPAGRSDRVYDFFGRKALLPTGALQIALKSGAALIPSFIWREGKYNHRQVIGEPVELDRTGSKEEMLEKNMKKVLPVMEKYISEHVSEWEMFHDIWKD